MTGNNEEIGQENYKQKQQDKSQYKPS